jgi:fatty-acyl-CoA synthase
MTELRAAAHFSEAALRQHVRERLAGYKVPKRVLRVATIGRGVSGKVDYAAARARATELLAQ